MVVHLGSEQSHWVSLDSTPLWSAHSSRLTTAQIRWAARVLQGRLGPLKGSLSLGTKAARHTATTPNVGWSQKGDPAEVRRTPVRLPHSQLQDVAPLPLTLTGWGDHAAAAESPTGLTGGFCESRCFSDVAPSRLESGITNGHTTYNKAQARQAEQMPHRMGNEGPVGEHTGFHI